MKGSIVKRYGGTSYALILDLGVKIDPETGRQRRNQKWIAFRPTAEHTAKCSSKTCSPKCEAFGQASAKLAELLKDHHAGTLVEPSKRTVGEWFDEWMARVVTPSLRENTVRSYSDAIRIHLRPALGAIPLQELRPSHLLRYYAEKVGTLSNATLQGHHVILSSALQIALADNLVTRNVARAVGKRQRPKNLNEADPKLNCWSLAEAQTFLAASKGSGPQLAALFALAIDTGMRRGEICGLRWADVNLEAATVRVEQQLLNWKTSPPVFGPPKSKSGKRTVDINAETVRLLVAHKSAQASLKMRNRTIYHDLGLVFARDWADTRNLDTLGLPLNPDDLGNRAFARVQKAANVRRISFHGLRHTCATLLLGAGVPVHEVAARLGHSEASMTLNIYAHALPSQQKAAAAKLGALLASGG